ncbi:MAG: amino acid adenylation domain-containing protein [Gemmatimonadales bacterium]
MTSHHNGAEAAEIGVIGASSRDEAQAELRHPLSPLQEGMLFHELAATHSGTNIEQIVVTLDEAVDPSAVRAAWERMAGRHPMLRASFGWQGLEHPETRVHRAIRAPLLVEDWTEVGPELHGAMLERFLDADRQVGFRLDQAPLFRLGLFRRGTAAWTLVWTFHHILCDGRAFPIVLRDALTPGSEAGAREDVAPSGGYAGYVAWLRSRELAGAESWWRQTLRGFSAPTPIGFATAGGPAFRDGRHPDEEVELSEPGTRALEAAAARHGVTLNTLVQGAWALLLSRGAGEEDVVFGATRALRRDSVPGADDLVGLCINTVAVRVRARSDARLGEWLRELRAVWRAGRPHAAAPLNRIQGWSEVPAGTPLFDSIVMFDTYQLERRMQALGGAWAARRLRLYERNTFALTLAAYGGERLALRLEYDPGRVTRDTARRLLSRYRRILEAMAHEDDPILRTLDDREPEEQLLVVRTWNDTDRPYPLDLTLVDLLERQVERTPDAPAVTFDGVTLAYRELHRRAEHLAALLAARGVSRGSLVAVCLDRSIEMVVSLLAVLKAGAAYVPVDPDYPPERVRFMLEDAAPALLLTLSRQRSALPDTDVAIVEVDGVRSGSRPVERPRPAPGDPAYMIYTSGSTGRPKGALNAHRGIVNRLLWMQEQYLLGPSDSVLQKTPFSFDVSVWEFFWPLIVGARLVVARPGGHQEPAYLAQLIARERVTVLHFVPSMLAAFVDAADPARCVSLRHVMASGEALPWSLQERFFARFGAQLHNLYGPTEAAVDVSHWTCVPGDPRGIVPIGRPVANTQLYILDPELRPVPIGVAGELFIGGVQVGLGYYRRPELTAERFVPDPFRAGTDPGARLYRTGDRARFLPDGAIEYLGRFDDQVKLRGFRIELGEIEAALEALPGVRRAAVAVRQDGPGAARLVAYLVGDGPTRSLAEVRRELARTLPEHMLPAAVVPLDELPLSPNGKLDRRRLPAPESRAEAAPAYRAPEGEPARTLAAIWSAVLRLERVGLDDDFLALGGDSILSIQIVSRARAAGLELNPRDLFRYPTLAALAAEARPVAESEAAPVDLAGEVPLAPIQRWLLDREPAGLDHWNQAFLLRVPATLDDDVLDTAARAAVAQHDAFRLRFARERGVWTQRYAAESAFASLQRHDLRAHPAPDIPRAIGELARAAHEGLSIERGPLIRLVWIRLLEEMDNRLLIVAHHLVIDGVSWGIFLEDLAAASRQAAGGLPVSLPRSRGTFRGWTEALRRRSVNAALDRELPLWRRMSVAAPPLLPADGAAAPGANREGTARTLVVTLDHDTTEALLRRVPGAYGTRITETLVMALARGLGAGPDRPLRVDLEGHGREELPGAPDVSRMIGWFTALFPLRLVLPEARDSGADLLAVKEQMRAIPEGGTGFGILRYLRGEPELAATAPAEILFNYLGQFDRVLGDSGLFAFAPESAGPWRSDGAERSHAVEINAAVAAGCLEIRWTWSPSLHRDETIREAAERVMSALRAIVAHASARPARRYSPADFPLVSLTQRDLERLIPEGAAVSDILPLTAMQELFLAAGGDGTGRDVGVEQWRYRLRGPVDVEAFTQAWRTVMERHAALRAAFVTEGLGQPVQVIPATAELPITVLDWTGASGEDLAQRLETLLGEDRTRGFARGSAPLMRVTLIRTGEADWTCIWTHHHLLLDRGSWPLVLRDVGILYRSRLVETTPALEPPSSWASFLSRGVDRAAAEEFWREELAGAAPVPLSPDRGESGAKGSGRRSIGREITAELKAIAAACRVTVNATVTAAWAACVSRITGSADVVLGLAVAGRDPGVPGMDRLVGLCANNLPLRLRLESEDGMSAVAQRVLERQWVIERHTATPLTAIHAWSGLPPHRRVFDTLLVFQHHGAERDHRGWLGDLVDVEPAPIDTGTNFPLTLVVAGQDVLDLELAWRGPFATADDAARLLESLERVLGEVAGNPNLTVGDALKRIEPWPAVAAAPARASAPPRTATEWVVARIWQELLDRPVIGVTEGFFDLGGHSLVATRILSRLREAFGIELPVSAVFDHPTVAGLAEAIAARGRTPDEVERIAGVIRRVEEMSAAEVREAILDG